MVKDSPRLSIGLPVYNGEKYLKQAINSVLAQTYTDYELIISDNASTDRTKEICLEYAKKDKRIKYYRSKVNRGAAWNWNRVFTLASGVYFKWVAHDDTMNADFIEKCINMLEKDPSIIICHCRNAVINKYDKLVGKYDVGEITDSYKPHERFRDLLQEKGTPWLIFGVIRREALGRTPVFQRFIGSDWNLLAEISLRGRIYEIPEYLFLRRDHEESYTNSHYSQHVRIHDYRTESLWWTGSKKRSLIVLPHWRNCLEFFRSVNRVSMSYSEKWRCYQEIGRWLLGRGRLWLKGDISNEIELWRLKLNKIPLNH
jgi:glycosyltransferase involved in cell wall biosynthesis